MDIAKAGGWPTRRSTSSGRLKFELALMHTLRAYPRNGRRHSNKQRRQIATGLRKLSFLNPVLVDGELIDRLAVEGFESFEQIGAARLASDEVPRRRRSGPATFNLWQQAR
jgi:hypothetical protein